VDCAKKPKEAHELNILSYNPGHDGAIVHLKDARLVACIEAEKNSNYRYAPVSGRDVFIMLSEIGERPDAICISGWWRRDHYEYLHGSAVNVGYRGLSKSESILERRQFLGAPVHYFSSSHERSHILCAFGLSALPRGTPCYALVWEGEMGTFYEIDSELNIALIADVLTQPGNRYGLLYGLADPTFPKNGPYPRTTDAGKLMALASFSRRSVPSHEEKQLLEFLLDGPYCDTVMLAWKIKSFETSPVSLAIGCSKFFTNLPNHG
jgi:predicted NodU family carbamoyl transferase